jgi:hypothetical protein
VVLDEHGSPSSEEVSKIPFDKIREAGSGIEFSLHMKRNSILHYTGLSERNMGIYMMFPVGRPDISRSASGDVRIRPPTGFEVAQSSVPGKFGRIVGEWETEIPAAYSGIPWLRVTMRNEKLSRLDHIIDSSIAALLGVGVGGILNAYLALILLSRHHSKVNQRVN